MLTGICTPGKGMRKGDNKNRERRQTLIVEFLSHCFIPKVHQVAVKGCCYSDTTWKLRASMSSTRADRTVAETKLRYVESWNRS